MNFLFYPFRDSHLLYKKVNSQEQGFYISGFNGFFTVFFKTFASGYTCGVSWINGGIKWSLHDEALSWNFGYTFD